MRTLTPNETRVLATLMEKARTVPDSYPLSLNALLLGCNQKTSRDPVMDMSEAQAQAAIDTLKAQSLVFEASSSRVPRFEHNFQRGFAVNEPQAVLLGLLMLRGPQTPGELRTNSERWYKFADVSSVEGFLNELAERSDEKGGPLALLLPRAPGAREPRWVHLLCGPVAGVNMGSSATEGIADAEFTNDRAALIARVTTLENEMTLLRGTVQKLCDELGLSQPGQT